MEKHIQQSPPEGGGGGLRTSCKQVCSHYTEVAMVETVLFSCLTLWRAKKWVIGAGVFAGWEDHCPEKYWEALDPLCRAQHRQQSGMTDVLCNPVTSRIWRSSTTSNKLREECYPCLQDRSKRLVLSAQTQSRPLPSSPRGGDSPAFIQVWSDDKSHRVERKLHWCGKCKISIILRGLSLDMHYRFLLLLPWHFFTIEKRK